MYLYIYGPPFQPPESTTPPPHHKGGGGQYHTPITPKGGGGLLYTYRHTYIHRQTYKHFIHTQRHTLGYTRERVK